LIPEPRIKADLICIVKETRGLRGVDDVQKIHLHVRRNKVLTALKWLTYAKGIFFSV
jgi:hypothetical protein